MPAFLTIKRIGFSGKIMRKGALYCALDITAGKIAAAAITVKRNGEIADMVCQSGPSAGVRSGAILELGDLANAIAAVLKKLVCAGAPKIKSVYACLQGPRIKSIHSLGVIPVSERSNKIITSGDIARVTQHAYSLGLNINEQVIHQAAQGYTIDNHSRVLNPAGLYGHRLEVDLLLITAANTDVENLISAIDLAGCRVRGIVSSAYAAGEAVVAAADKAKGCVLLDIGFDTTQLLVFKDGIVRGFETFGMGSSHISEALARELKLTFELAEAVKISYGSAISHHIGAEAEVLIKKEQSYRPIKRKEICLVIEKELSVLFAEIKKRLEVFQKTLDLPAGIIASGKIALLEGFLESLERHFNMPVRLAKIDHSALRAASAASGDLTYAAAVGAVRYALSQAPRIDFFRLSSYGNVFQKIMHKSKEIYQEYF